MLPIPFKKFIPSIFSEDAKSDSVSTKADIHLMQWWKDILDFQRLVRPDECPSDFLNELAFFLNANLLPNDSESIKRKKIYNAVAKHKVRGTWKYDIKIRIDTITGLDSSVFHTPDNDDWAVMGGGETLPFSGYYWGTMGYNGTDLNLGLYLVGTGNETLLAGNIRINCHVGITTPVLTADQIKKIVLELSSDVLPAYYRIYLGYVDGSSGYQVYTQIT